MKKNTNQRIIFIGLILLILCIATGCTRRGHIETYRQAGIDYLSLGEYEKALGEFNEALSLSMSVGEIQRDTCMYKALSHYLLNEYSMATDAYTSLIEYDKDDWEIYFLRGCCYLSGNENTMAISDFEKTCELAPGDLGLYEKIAGALEDKGLHDQALQFLNLGMEKLGDSSGDDIRKGQLYLLMGQNEAACDRFETALSQNERIATLYLAKAAIERGSMVEAMSYVDESNKWTGVTAMEYELRGRTKLRIGLHEEALRDFRDGIALKDEQYMQTLKKGEIAGVEHLGRFEEAKELVNVYLATYPNDTDVAREALFLSTR